LTKDDPVIRAILTLMTPDLWLDSLDQTFYTDACACSDSMLLRYQHDLLLRRI